MSKSLADTRRFVFSACSLENSRAGSGGVYQGGVGWVGWRCHIAGLSGSLPGTGNANVMLVAISLCQPVTAPVNGNLRDGDRTAIHFCNGFGGIIISCVLPKKDKKKTTEECVFTFE